MWNILDAIRSRGITYGGGRRDWLGLPPPRMRRRSKWWEEASDKEIKVVGMEK